MNGVKRHCYEIYNKIIEQEQDIKVEFKVINNPLIRVLGYISPFCKNYKIVININSIKKLNQDDRKFYLYSTIYHEIEHIKMYEETKKEDCNNWESIIQLLENISYLNMFDIKPNDIYSLTVDNKKIGKMLAKNYELSSSELKSRLVGLSKAKEKTDKKVDNLIETAKITNDNIEIIYAPNGSIQDKYKYIIYETSKYISKYPEILNIYQVLKNFYNNNGQVKSLLELYKTRNRNNSEVYDKFILYLISIGYYDTYIYDEQIRKYINQIITVYYNNKVEYIEKSNLTKVFISDVNLIKENILVIQKRIQSLTLFLKKQNIERKIGTILI